MGGDRKSQEWREGDQSCGYFCSPLEERRLGVWRYSATSGRKEKVGDLSKKEWNEQELYQTPAEPVIPIITGMTEDACLLWELGI